MTTKRPCPFEESFENQKKILVTERQINTGIMKSQNMNKIYDLTLRKLNAGSKLPLQPINRNNAATKSMFKVPEQTKSPLKQLEINFNGQLKVPKTSLVHSHVCRKIFCCEGCDTHDFPSCDASKCSYCEVILCDKCVKHCVRCSYGHCVACSSVQYSPDSENVVCISCI